jgi:hypothetical protein
LSRNSTTKWRQLSPLIPHFQRFESDVFTPAKLKAVEEEEERGQENHKKKT